ncbi:MAG: LytTR family DNA-binding domain-containing protein [Myxococcota bacterium]
MRTTDKKRVIIIDDEPAALDNMRSVLNSFDELEIVAEANNGRAAIAEIATHRPDIVFLDIEMPETGGLDVAAATAHLPFQLVFVTAYERYALDAFDTNAIDYLLKPVRPSLLEKCIRKMLYQEGLVLEALEKSKSRSDRLVLTDGSESRILQSPHICFIEGIGRYRRIHLNSAGVDEHRMATIVSDTTLDDFESRLPAWLFLRIHRSYIVNLNHVIALSTENRRQFAKLSELGIKVPVSRSKVTKLRRIL